jgi:hypothetical protein
MKKKIAIFKNRFGVRLFETMKPEFVFLKDNETMIIEPNLSNVQNMSPVRWKLNEENIIVPRALGEK